jgi:hypothetical protein
MRHLLLPPNSFLIRVFDRLQSSRTGVCVLIGGETFGGNHIEWRSREPVWELAAFQSAEVGYRMLQIQHIFSRQNRHREPFARGWWRRERYWKLTFSGVNQSDPAKSSELKRIG